MQRTSLALVASFLTMAVVTVGGVLLFYRPLAEHDVDGAEWHPLIAILVYLMLSIALFHWAAGRMRSSFSAAFVIAAAQSIFIVDLLARGERGLSTAIAGVVLTAATWIAVAFVHSRLTGAVPVSRYWGASSSKARNDRE